MALKTLALGMTLSLSQATTPPKVFTIGTRSEKMKTVSMGFEADLETGILTEIASNFIYLGPSIAIDGISAFDKKNGLIYWTNDAATTFVYGLNVKTGEILPPIDTYGNAIGSLSFDDTTGELLIGDFPSPGICRLLRYSESNVDIYSYNGTVITSCGTVVPGNLYINWNFPKTRLETIDLSTGKVLKETTVDPECGLITNLFSDPSDSKSLIALQGSLSGYNYTKLDISTGSCTTPVTFDIDPMTSAAFDHRTGLVWYAKTNATGVFINTLSPKTGQQTSKQMKTKTGVVAIQELALLF